MSIGIFDSGLGGLVMTRAFRAELPQHDFLYLGDTLHVPYGPRSSDAIFTFTHAAVDYLFKQGCPLVLIACNTASANALRRLQQDYLPENYPDRRILGVIIPTSESVAALKPKRVGLIGTAFTVQSGIYEAELRKLDPSIELFSRAAPFLVPLVENNGLKYAEEPLRDYLAPLLEKNIDTLILGCTHYPLFKPLLKKILPPNVRVISQDDILPPKLADYLKRHPRIDKRIGRTGALKMQLTDVTPTYQAIADDLLGETRIIEKITL
jgi:glutamate racemase